MATPSAPVFTEKEDFVLCKNPRCLTSSARHTAYDIKKDPESEEAGYWHLRKKAIQLVCTSCGQPGCIDKASSKCLCCNKIVDSIETHVCRECKKPAYSVKGFYVNPGDEECDIISFCDEACGDFPHYMMKLDCGHKCCLHCFVGALDNSISDKSGITIVAEGDDRKIACLKCPIESKCIAKVTDSHLLALSNYYRKFQTFSAEILAGSMGAIFCPLPRCGNMILDVPKEDGVVACPWCLRNFCTHCNEAAPLGVCPSSEGNEEATQDRISTSCKNCPKCGWAISHCWHDECHHIGYQIGGCPGCRITRQEEFHWCYVCLKGGSRYPQSCIDDHWWCDDSCDCPPCPLCNRGKLDDLGRLKEGKTRSPCRGHK